MIGADRPAAWRSLAAPTAATAVALAILAVLGIWQLERKAWKEDLLEQVRSRAYGAPVDVPAEADWPGWRAANGEFTRVWLSGRFKGDETVPVHGLAEIRRNQASQGYYLFTPLRREDGTAVVVNRGFVPGDQLRATLDRLQATDGGVSEVVGLVRAPEERGWFVPENQPDKNEWFVRNLTDMAASRRLVRWAPFYVDAGPNPTPTGWPRGGQTQLTLPNNHLQYAFTWFGLGGALIGVYGRFAWRRLSGRDRDTGAARAGTAPERGGPGGAIGAGVAD